MRILLLGGGGGIGEYIYDALTTEHMVERTYSNAPKPGAIKYDVATDSLTEIIGDRQFDILINNINPLTLSFSATARLAEQVANYCKETKAYLMQVSSVSADDSNKLADSYSMKKHITDEIVLSELRDEPKAILRYPQIFDYLGHAKKAQAGLYYIVDTIRNGKPMSLFMNADSMMRNYLPVELLVDSIKYTIEHRPTGVHNVYVPAHTQSLKDIILLLAGISGTYDTTELLTEGTNTGTVYHLPEPSAQFNEWVAGYRGMDYYFAKLYNGYKG